MEHVEEKPEPMADVPDAGEVTEVQADQEKPFQHIRNWRGHSGRPVNRFSPWEE